MNEGKTQFQHIQPQRCFNYRGHLYRKSNFRYAEDVETGEEKLFPCSEPVTPHDVGPPIPSQVDSDEVDEEIEPATPSEGETEAGTDDDFGDVDQPAITEEETSDVEDVRDIIEDSELEETDWTDTGSYSE